MKTLFGQTNFVVGEREYNWGDVILAAQLRGDWEALETQTRAGIACLDQFAIACTDEPPRSACDCGTICQIVPHAQLHTDLKRLAAEGGALAQQEIDGAANEFRYARDLI